MTLRLQTQLLATQVVGTRIWRRALNLYQVPSCRFTLTMIPTGYDDMPLSDDVPILNIPKDATSEIRWSVLTITNAKYGCHTKSGGTHGSSIFTLESENTVNTDRTNYNHISTVSELLQFANSPIFNHTVTTASFTTNQAIHANCFPMALLVSESDFLYFYYLIASLFNSQNLKVPYKNSYPLHFGPRFLYMYISPS